MKISKTVTIKINAEFGSDWQKEVHMKSLKILMTAWQMSVEEHHKKNKSEVIINE